MGNKSFLNCLFDIFEFGKIACFTLSCLENVKFPSQLNEAAGLVFLQRKQGRCYFFTPLDIRYRRIL